MSDWQNFDPADALETLVAGSRTSVDELLALQRASKRLQHVLAPEELAQETIGILEDTLGYEFAAILLIDEYSDRLLPFALSDQGKGADFLKIDRDYLIAQDVRLGQGITGWVAAHGQSVRSDDVRQDSRYHSVRSSIVSELCVPMRMHGRVIGVVNVESSRPNAYSESDQRVLEIVGSQIAVAVENSRLQAALVHSQRLDAVGRVASGIAHDFNNLLSVIGGYAELILVSEDIDAETCASAGEIKAAVLRAADMTRQLLAFSRKSPLSPEALNPGEEIASLKPMLARLLGESIELSIRAVQQHGMVEVDRAQFRQVLVNLVVNARDAMPDGGKLDIVTSGVEVSHASPYRQKAIPPGQYVTVTVADTGVGLTETARRTLFEPFVSTKPGGSGLGLAMAHGVIRQSGGHIRVESGPGLGTRFTIYLPLVDKPKTPDQPVSSELPAPSITGHVLVVDDDESVRNVVTQQLESLGYAVLRASGAAEAMEIARTPGMQLALVVSDIVMPDMYGPEVVDQIRQFHPHVRTLFMSGYPQRSLDNRGVFTETESLISKPFTRSTLKLKLREVLDGQSTSLLP